MIEGCSEAIARGMYAAKLAVLGLAELATEAFYRGAELDDVLVG